MLRFLLDEHISPAVCSAVRARQGEIKIESLITWQSGSLRGKDDRFVLRTAAEAGYTFVTYDLRTIPALFQLLAVEGLSHHGVVFIDERTCRPQDFAGIADALIRIWNEFGTAEWTDRVIFASRSISAD